jgi:hypothetical protein
MQAHAAVLWRICGIEDVSHCCNAEAVDGDSHLTAHKKRMACWECLLHVSTFATARVALPTGVEPVKITQEVYMVLRCACWLVGVSA